MPEHARAEIVHLDQFGSRKGKIFTRKLLASLEDDLSAWMQAYLDLVVAGERSRNIADKIELHLDRFTEFFFRR